MSASAGFALGPAAAGGGDAMSAATTASATNGVDRCMLPRQQEVRSAGPTSNAPWNSALVCDGDGERADRTVRRRSVYIRSRFADAASEDADCRQKFAAVGRAAVAFQQHADRRIAR